MFSIDPETLAITYLAEGTAPEGAFSFEFATRARLRWITVDWPVSRLAEAWNSFAGVAPFGDLKPVNKFQSREIAVDRIWDAIQKLVPADAPPTTPAKAEKRPAKAAAKPKAAKEAAPAGTRKEQVIALVSRKGGATLDEIMKATGWQRHTVRGFMSTLHKKGGPAIESSKRESDGARVYTAR